MTEYTFNTTPLKQGPVVTGKGIETISATLTFRRASLQNALLFGGPLIRSCLEDCPLVGDRDYTLVDTKVALLLPGFIPSIPGWHTDGAPRHHSRDGWDEYSPFFYGPPSQAEQLRQSEAGYFPRYHSVHVGIDCPTEFMSSGCWIDLEHGEDEGLYKEMGEKVTAMPFGPLDKETLLAPYGQWLSWDWWRIHRAVPAKQRGWRVWIRVTECDDPPLEHDFIVRPQTQIYVVSEDQAW